MHGDVAPSEWVVRWAPLIKQGRVLDVACGSGRHSKYFLQRGLDVVALDRDPVSLEKIRFIQANLEDGSPWPLPGEQFEGIIVTKYLYRPLFETLRKSLAGGGILIYETFMVGNERFGKPSNPAFLLRRGELLEAFRELTVLGFEEGEQRMPKPAMIQRLCAMRASKG